VNNTLLHTILRKHLVPAENFIYGFAGLNGLLHEKFSEYPYGISIGRRLDDRILDKIINGPTLEYLDHYSAINQELTGICQDIANELNEKGINALSVNPTFATDPVTFDRMLPTLRYDLSHKMVATRAGLGWIGKTDLFISKKFGARLRLSSILIGLEIIPEGKPINKSRCGKCVICVEQCPAKAANGKLWDIQTDRDLFFDAFKCRVKCSEFGREVLKIDRRICGICVAVCPVARLTEE
jgi:epoxyqueuosine reductase